MRRRLAVIAVASAVVACIAAAVWQVRPVRSVFWTDGAGRIAGEAAQVRDVLWTPAVGLAALNTADDEYEARESGDGATLFFVRGRAGGDSDVFVAAREGRSWTDPAPAEGLSGEWDDLGPCPTADGRAIYFYSDRPGGLGGYDIWVAQREGHGWSEPSNLGPRINSPWNDYGPALSPDGAELWFSSNRPPAEGGEPADRDGAWSATLREELHGRPYDIYRAPVAGESPARLARELCSAENDGAAALSPAGDFIYFSSDRAGGAGGFDLYRARLRGDEVGGVENLGPPLNTAASEMDPSLAMEGFALVFSSDRAGSGTYDLFRSVSREVYRDVEVTRADLDWRAILTSIWPWIAALLACLLLLGLLGLFANDERWRGRWRALSLMTKCVLLSAMVHVVLMMIFAAWQVTTGVSGMLRRGGAMRVALVSHAVGGDGEIAAQLAASPGSAPADPAPADREPDPSIQARPEEVPRFEAPVALAMVREVSPVAMMVDPAEARARATAQPLDPATPVVVSLPAPQGIAIPDVAEPRELSGEAGEPVVAMTEAGVPDSAPPLLISHSLAPREELDAPMARVEVGAAAGEVAAGAIGEAVHPAARARDLVEGVVEALPAPELGSVSSIESAPRRSAGSERSPEATIPGSLAGAPAEALPGFARALDGGSASEEFAAPAARVSIGALPMHDAPDAVVDIGAPELAAPGAAFPALGLPRYDVALPTAIAEEVGDEIELVLSGVVVDAEDGGPIAGAAVRLDLADGAGAEASSGPGGEFELRMGRDLPDHVAVSATADGYDPGAVSVPRSELERGAHVVVLLRPVSSWVIAVEQDPVVHHLGNDQFEGMVNSQFQKRSEGVRYEAQFGLDERQARAAAAGAVVSMLVRGAQVENEVWINGRRIAAPLTGSPQDGSFGPFRALVPGGWLRAGTNTVSVRSQRASHTDEDDFEFINIQFELDAGLGDAF